MADKVNAYYKLIQDDDGIKMTLYPPVGEGDNLNIDEILKYLDIQKIKDYDIGLISDTIKSLTEQITIKISSEVVLPVDEYARIVVSPDKMFAVAKFYPESNTGKKLTKEDILDSLSLAGVKFGIRTEIIDAYLRGRVYNRGIILAKGQPVVQGKNAEIKYNFNTDRTAKPHLNDDGTVDFHQLDNISHVQAGDVLAVLIPEIPGTDGKTVTGEVIKAAKVNRAVLKYGNNITLSADGLKITSNVDGHVTLDGDKVFVSNVFKVPADIDNSTGDIEYAGSVEVNGNVRTGFKIKSEGDVEVKGVVEGAEIIAKGDIILHRGVQGKQKAFLKAGGNVVSKFIESAKIEAAGYVSSDTILHSEINAEGDISVEGRNGSIIGGHIRSGNVIKATVIGTDIGTTTEVEVGCDPAIIKRVGELKKIMADITEEKVPMLTNVAQLRKKQEKGGLMQSQLVFMKESVMRLKELDENYKTAEDEYKQIAYKVEENKGAKIQITREIYPGAKVIISGDYILIHQVLSHCQFRKDRGEIRPESF